MLDVTIGRAERIVVSGIPVPCAVQRGAFVMSRPLCNYRRPPLELDGEDSSRNGRP